MVAVVVPAEAGTGWLEWVVDTWADGPALEIILPQDMSVAHMPE